MTKAQAAKVEKNRMIGYILKSRVFVERCILALYERQTASEKVDKAAEVDNNAGFSGVHAPIMTSFAEWIIKGRTQYHKAEGACLSDAQLVIARRILQKYTRQLIEIEKEKKGEQLPLQQMA